MSWEEALEAWRKRSERKKGDAPSIKSEHAMRNVANELRERSLLPNTLAENDVWAWIREMETQAPLIAPSTIRTKTSMLKALTKALATQKLINADPLLDAEFRASRHRYGVWQAHGGIAHPWDFRRRRRSAAIPDGTTPGGRRYRCKEIGSYARAQELLAQGHTYLDGNGDGEACESLR